MLSERIITLTTDFGLADTFVGQMKGRILALCPQAAIVDLTHSVPAHDVAAGSFLLLTAYRAFPEGTIHVAVVDPGVGTERRGLVVRTERFVFVAPDNGLLTRALDRERTVGAWEIAPDRGPEAVPAPTFHGRDVFAPVAARIAAGAEPSSFGPRVDTPVRLDPPRETARPGVPFRVRVVHVDRFGNATLDLPRALLEPALGGRGDGLRAIAPRGEARGLERTYGERAAGDRGAFLLFNSADFLEIAIYGASAAATLGLRAGVEVELVFPG